MDILGKIFNIQRFCTSDGPGIRTTVFFKGCPLRCKWCHNPESQHIESELMFDKAKCINCMHCVSLCKNKCHKTDASLHLIDRTKCISCGKCTEASCGALELVGKEMTPASVIEEVIKDKLYFDNSGGGITLSGGEPLFQDEFCFEVLRAAKEKSLHICIETCGAAPQEVIARSAEYVDLYLYDLKHTDSESHRSFTGVGNEKIIDNLFLLDSLGKSIILRCPIIPKYNDTDKHFSEIANISKKLKNLTAIEIEPYHNFGEIKYDKLSRIYEAKNATVMTEEDICGLITRLNSMCNVTVRSADQAKA